MHSNGGACEPAGGHIMPVTYGTAWSRSLDGYHLAMVQWSLQEHQPQTSAILGWALRFYLEPPREVMSLQIVALPGEQHSDTTEVEALEWYSGRALQVELPGELNTANTFITQILSSRPWITVCTPSVVIGNRWRGPFINIIDSSSGVVHNYELGKPPFDIEAMASSPNGSCLAVAQEMTQLRVWNWSPWREKQFAIQDVQAIAFAPSGNLLAIWHALYLQHITILMVETGEEIRSTPLEAGVFMHDGAVHPQEENVVFVGAVHDLTNGFLLMLDIRCMKVKYRLELIEHTWVSEVAYDPTGKLIAVCGTKGITTLDIESGTLTSLFSDQVVNSITYTPSGVYLVAGTQSEVLLFHVATYPHTMERLPLPWGQGYHISSITVVGIARSLQDTVEER